MPEARYHRVNIVGDNGGSQYRKHVNQLFESLDIIRAQRDPAQEGVDTTLHTFGSDNSEVLKRYDAFRERYAKLWQLVNAGTFRSISEDRLRVLRHRFDLHRDLNADYEDNHHRLGGGGDVQFAAKHDTRRIGTAMTSGDLVNLIRHAIETEPERVMYTSGKQKVSLKEVADEFFSGLPPGERRITAEGLCITPNYYHTTQKRFDVFEKGQPLRPRADPALKLLRHFLKYQWGGNGSYLAQLLRPQVGYASTKDGSNVSAAVGNQFLDLEVTVHGLRPGELEMIGGWAMQHNVLGPNTKFVIRFVQRHHKVKYAETKTFDDVLNNIFGVLLEAQVNPEKHPGVAFILENTTAISVAIDHHGEGSTTAELPLASNPAQFGGGVLPPDVYFFFFAQHYTQRLNSLRKLQQKHAFQFRIHAESNHHGASHCVAGMLLADVLLNPVAFVRQPACQYIAYLLQIPLVMSPSLNNGTGLPFVQQPLAEMLKAGLNLSLATIDPLHYHESRDSLNEEYRTAAKNNYFSAPDVCEMALNSVLNMAQLSDDQKVKLVGNVAQIEILRHQLLQGNVMIDEEAVKRVTTQNEFTLSNVPTLRVAFRRQSLLGEIQLLAMYSGANTAAPKLHQQMRMLPNSAKESLKTIAPQAIEHDLIFPRIVIAGPKIVTESATKPQVLKKNIATDIIGAMHLRNRFLRLAGKATNVYLEKYHPHQDLPPITGADPKIQPAVASGNLLSRVKLNRGVISIEGWQPPPGHGMSEPMPRYEAYRECYKRLQQLAHDPTAQIFARRRLQILQHKFDLHGALVEHESEKSLKDIKERGDAYRCVKVDTHVHMASGITGKDLLHFIKEKVTNHSDDVIMMGDRGEPITLGHFFTNVLRIDVDELSVAALDVQADRSTFNRFDQFNGKYNPLGLSMLRTLFLKTENFMQGRYFAELVRLTLDRQAKEGTTFSEFRLSIYGKNRNEWNLLANWFVTHGMSSAVNRWMLQIPRIYHIYFAAGIVKSFGEMLDNIFHPLWEASINPESHPFLSHFLDNISGFDTVDNEDVVEHEIEGVEPHEWTRPENPSYSYWAYHLWANITSLNNYRRSKNMTTFSFRPHCGESGDPDHLVDGFLLADGVNHGINLRHRPVLQYLYYLQQIGLSITPLSNNALFCPYNDNPFPTFFRCGLNVTLSTDGPLQFHHTQQPLIEEYGIAAKFWKLSLADTSEIAVNSVRQCGFPLTVKQKWLGPLCELSSSVGNDARLSHLPDIRVAFRFEVYHEEISYLESRAGHEVGQTRAMPELVEEEIIIAEVVGKTSEAIKAAKNQKRVGHRRLSRL